MSKVFVLGIDCAPPEYVFGEWLDELPNIKKLKEKGCYARLNSTMPPLSSIAWPSITTGKTPSDLGFFEHFYRKNHSYEDIQVISSRNVKEKRIWEILSEHGKKSIVTLIPLTWPIKPFNGILVSGYMTPGIEFDYTYPKEIKEEINSLFDEDFIIDSDFRNISEDKIIESCYKSTKMHFKLNRHLLKNKEWDLFFGVISESDNINHVFLKYCDKKHRKYYESKYKNTMKEFYKFVDAELGKLLELLDEDTKIIVLSDHGIIRMHTRINLSDWLIKEGYLVLKEPVTEERTRLKMDMIDWSKTKVFGISPFEAHIYVNLMGRDPQGIVEPEQYEGLLYELEEKIKKIPGDHGEKLNTKIFIKKRDYNGKRIDEVPDMIIYFDDLEYGVDMGFICNKVLWGPDEVLESDAQHSKQGVVFMDNKKCKGDLGEISYLDITPTILNELGIPIPEDMKGKPII